jgi:transglutaminase-like putative cysteine protease
VLLPQLGWVGFDPTNDIEAGERHVRVAIGRDYADVPPARSVCKGMAGNTMTVTVAISPTDVPDPLQPFRPSTSPSISHVSARTDKSGQPSLQQQQRQQ